MVALTGAWHLEARLWHGMWPMARALQMCMAVCGPSAWMGDNPRPIQAHFFIPENNPCTSCCSSAEEKGQLNGSFALSSCLFQCVVPETACSRRRSRERKGLGRLGRVQAPLLWVSPVLEQACREWGGLTRGLESWDPQVQVTPVASLETLLCSRPWPGLCRKLRDEPDSVVQVFT